MVRGLYVCLLCLGVIPICRAPLRKPPWRREEEVLCDVTWVRYDVTQAQNIVSAWFPSSLDGAPGGSRPDSTRARLRLCSSMKRCLVLGSSRGTGEDGVGAGARFLFSLLLPPPFPGSVD